MNFEDSIHSKGKAFSLKGLSQKVVMLSMINYKISFIIPAYTPILDYTYCYAHNYVSIICQCISPMHVGEALCYYENVYH